MWRRTNNKGLIMESIDAKYDRLIMFVVDSIKPTGDAEFDEMLHDLNSEMINRLLAIKGIEAELRTMDCDLADILMSEEVLMRMFDSDDYFDFGIGLN